MSERAIIRNQPQTVKMESPAKPSAAPVALTWETPIRFLKGVGPRRCDLFKRLGLNTLRDLIYHLPRRHEDRRAFLPIAQLVPGQKGTACGEVTSISLFRARTGTLILQVIVRDASGSLTALWFNQPYMRRWFPKGQRIILYGSVERIGRKLQMAAPEFEVIPPEASTAAGQAAPGKAPVSLHMGRIVPIYPATSGLHQRELRTAVATALKAMLPLIQDPVPPELLQRNNLMDLGKALKGVHFPALPEMVAQAQARLTFDELLTFQMALGVRRRALQKKSGIAHEVNGDLVERWRKKLPFELTAGQEKAIQEIAKDMAAPSPMLRLLQGEVGSGKTVVATYAMVVAVQNGCQVALLAPTEVLARQHAITLSQFLSPINVQVRLLVSSLDPQEREGLRKDLQEGQVQVLVGTHAILEPWVSFKRLGLVVIDEQQKFGVDQRSTLVEKGNNPDVLILTATPIPRTLALTLYGELEISTIAQRPAGRQPVKTVWMDSTRRQEVYSFVRKELEAGRQAYVVCPRIGEGDGGGGPDDGGQEKIPENLFESPFGTKGWISAEEMFGEYRRIFQGYSVSLLHGQMSAAEQKAIFTAFKAGDIQVLVATQVIEVGVDVANATVMVIEGADRFGLSQLHQLRGRVGRGTHEATCILMADPKTPGGLQRLQTLVETSDAFKIAEEDMRLRGPGELLGKRQAGLPDLKCLQWASQGPWLEVTRKEAEELLKADPGLAQPAVALLKKEMIARFPQLLEGCA
ncbi:MAG: ATP-dependent DNA helicase RecG [Candidatus Omnitrophica bacterium]|nr:ATP-dependent DNA helicase RecG [Candidatus Omnitrophota bacterium]